MPNCHDVQNRHQQKLFSRDLVQIFVDSISRCWTLSFSLDKVIRIFARQSCMTRD